MPSDERHHRMDSGRVRAGLTVQDLWLRYLALGGTGDAFDVDGYLQGLVPLADFQQDVLAQALNEALEHDVRSYLVPPSAATVAADSDGVLRRLVDDLLDGRPPAVREDPEPPGVGPA